MYRLVQQLSRRTTASSSLTKSPSVTTRTVLRRSLFGGGAPQEKYSSLEYPTATEPPEITKTIAKDVRGLAPQKDDTKPVEPTETTVTEAVPQEYVAQLRQRPLSPGVSAISTNIPAEIPPNVPASQLERPEILVTALDNGVRVVSLETYGQVSVVGTVSGVGSQWEKPTTTGHASQLLEALSYGSTRQRSGLQVVQTLQDWGATQFSNVGREQALHCIDVLRPNVAQATGLLAECLLEPLFDPLEVEDAKTALQYQAAELPPELWLGEALQTAAYTAEQPLGQAHFCPPGDNQLAHLSAQTVADYWQTSFIDNPQEIVLAGAGVRHDTLVQLAQQYFGHLQQTSTRPTTLPKTTYQGGQCLVPHKPEDEFVRVGIVWPACGWHGDDLVATCVLQTLLGGGNSFSAGGPGKGMYSRLYREVLNRYSWAESAEACTAFYNDNGLWGLTGSCAPKKARDLIRVLAEHTARLAMQPVSDEELNRARNMLKNNVLTQLESRLVLFEDLGRQVLTYGKREDMLKTCQRIDAVTQQDLMRVARQSLQHPPSIAAVGEHLDDVPSHDEVARWFR